MKKTTLILFLLLSSFTHSQTLIKTYYDPLVKTKLKEIYQVKNNTPILNGYYKLYDEYGNLLEHKNYLNNKLNGKSTIFVGTYQASISYGGKKNIGEIFTVSNYKNDVLNGVELRYNFTKDGEKYLEFKKTYDNGILIKHIEYFSNRQEKKNLKIGKCLEYFENGNKYAEYTADGNGLRQGKYVGWYETGKILLTGNFLNDKKNGEWIEYNEDGSIKKKENYISGKRQKSETEKLNEENRKLLEKRETENRERLQSKKDIEEKKRIEQEKIEEKNYYKIQRLKEELYFEETNLKGNYKYWDEDKYSFKKEKLYNKYNTVIEFLKEDLKDKTSSDKILYYNLCIRLTKKMNNLVDENTKKMEKEISKIDDIQKIIDKILK